MENRQGSLSIHSDNLFPIIKKWLYSDHDIFVRELVSNGCDAVTKLKKLALMGEYRTPENETYQIQVEVSPKEKSIRFLDNGVGMSAEEVEKYINQIAFRAHRILSRLTKTRRRKIKSSDISGSDFTPPSWLPTVW